MPQYVSQGQKNIDLAESLPFPEKLTMLSRPFASDSDVETVGLLDNDRNMMMRANDYDIPEECEDKNLSDWEEFPLTSSKKTNVEKLESSLLKVHTNKKSSQLSGKDRLKMLLSRNVVAES